MTKEAAEFIMNMGLDEDGWFKVEGTRFHLRLISKEENPSRGQRVCFQVISPHRKGIPSRLTFDSNNIETDNGIVLVDEKLKS